MWINLSTLVDTREERNCNIRTSWGYIVRLPSFNFEGTVNMNTQNSRTVVRLLIILSFALCFGRAGAQWTKVSSIDHPNITRFGVFAYKQGVFWAGNASLYRSTNGCQSWTLMSQQFSNTIMGLDFYDSQNGILGDLDGTVYTTHDGGAIWKAVENVGSNLVSVRFGRNVNQMLACTESSPGAVYVSNDGGLTWNTNPLEDWVQDVATMIDGSLRAFSGTNPTGRLYQSKDDGANWQPLAGTTGLDAWSFAADSCDPNRLYLVNEEAAGSDFNEAYLWVSSNGGVSWQITLTRMSTELAGSIALGPHSIYCPTTVAGVLRSIDKGATWKLIGGPSCRIDSRQIVAVTDNELFVIDPRGDVWHTINSGGDSVRVGSMGSIATNVSTMFNGDTVAICRSLMRQAYVVRSGCGIRTIDSVTIVGQDSAFYSILHAPSGELSTTDSVVVLLTPSKARDYNATLVITLSDGSTVSIALQGTGLALDPMRAATSDVQTKAIGEGADVPLSLFYSIKKPTCDIVVDYDTSVLVYRGSSYANGVTHVSEVAGSSAGHLHLHLIGQFLTLDQSAALIHFDYYPLTSGCTQVTFDSLSIPGTIGCAAIEKLTSNICTTFGCGSPSVSRFMRYGELPSLTLSPNPSSASTSIVSAEDIGSVTIELIDALGSVRATLHSTMLAGIPIKINTSMLSTGAYFVRTRAEGFVKTLRLMHLK